jgi:hypothetical protein
MLKDISCFSKPNMLPIMVKYHDHVRIHYSEIGLFQRVRISE